MVPELKKLGEMVLADPLLRNRVVVAKVSAARLAGAPPGCPVHACSRRVDASRASD
jgi:hypothetical protein